MRNLLKWLSCRCHYQALGGGGMIHLIVNNRPVSVPDGTTILDAAKKLGINIPTLCYLNLHDINYVNETASCRVCMVEVEDF